ncbi:MAG: cyclomaltodextrinase N-terminal domain-containing protein [Bacteroidales bacterium]|nr:cyclomaltodextrinase N-terminal domain-containing protein [Bacteroidales bacterium]
MKRLPAFLAALALVSYPLTLGAQPALKHVEPLSWWTGMKTDLQLLVNGDGIGTYGNVSIEGSKGVSVKAVHKGDSPNYLFVDVDVAPDARPGTYTLVFSNGTSSVKYPYQIAARENVKRQSYTTADLIYLIVPDRFANGDPSNDSTPDTAEEANRSQPMGRHGGDLQGVIDHLDYIADLGATAIWSTPLLGDNARRGSYHGYACSDYYHIDPRYGTNAQYRELVQKAHSKGLKIILDVVTNHSSTEHWWMNDLPFKDCVHMNEPYVNSNHQMSLALDPNASKADLAIMENGWFSRGMPDMNLDNPFMLKYFQEWAVWWIEYSGLDGFRVDTWFYNEKVPMSMWAKAVTDEFPGFNIVGEVWNANPDYVAYWQGGNPNSDGFDSYLPSIMDFPLQAAMTGALTAPIPGQEQQGERPGGRGGRRGPDISAVYNALTHDFVYHDLSHMLIFLSNHDIARIGDTFGHDPRRMKIAFTMLATLRGIPQLFYGDEMMFVTGNPNRDDGRLRMDFPGGWKGDEVNLFTADGRKKASATEAWAHAEDLHGYARTLFQWRKGKEVIHSGKTLHFIPENNTYGYFRYNDKEVVFVFINNSDEAKPVTWTRFREITEGLGEGRNVLTGEKTTVNDQTQVPPYSTLVVEFNR